MKDNEIIDLIIADLKSAQTSNPSISVDALISYLESIKRYTGEKTAYDDKMHQRDLVTLQNNSEADIEMFKSVIDAGKDALKTIMIANGGAIVTLLALLGNLQKDLLISLSKNLTSALGMFSISVFLATILYGMRYLSQAYYSEDRLKVGNFFLSASVYLAIISYALFGFGLYKTYLAFLGLH